MTPPQQTAEDLEPRMAAFAAMLKDSGFVRSPLVERAFATVRRDRCVTGFHHPRTGERFEMPAEGPVPDALLDLIYSDAALMLYLNADGLKRTSSSSAPGLMANMIEALDVRPGMRVLEIGAGSGYNAAVLAAITGAEVVTVEASAQVAATARESVRRLGADQVRVVHADGYQGYAPGAPYQRIIVTVGCAGVSPQWLAQLDREGRLLVPIEHASGQPLHLLRHDQAAVHAQLVQWASFMSALGPLDQRDRSRYRSTARLPAGDLIEQRLGDPFDEPAYLDFWYYLGVRDRRTARVRMEGRGIPDGECALFDAQDGVVFALTSGSAGLAGDQRLLDDLAGYRQEWERLGRPAIRDWSCRLALRDRPVGPLYLPQDWRLQGVPIDRALAGLPVR